MEDLAGTREIWEDVIGEFPKMWMQDTYEGYDGKYWSLPPRKILPKPRHKPHPAMWYAAGNPSSYEMAARKGLGVLGFSVGDFASAEKAVASYKKAIADAEPIGAFVNDNLMCCIAAYVAEDREEAYRSYIDCAAQLPGVQRLPLPRHVPAPAEHVPNWPERIPEPTRDGIPSYLEAGALLLGDPDDALAQAKSWESIGVDQLVFGVGPAPIEETVRTIEAARQVRHPQDRHRPRAPHESAQGRRTTAEAFGADVLGRGRRDLRASPAACLSTAPLTYPISVLEAVGDRQALRRRTHSTTCRSPSPR